jgi:hypothetical protein
MGKKSDYDEFLEEKQKDRDETTAVGFVVQQLCTLSYRGLGLPICEWCGAAVPFNQQLHIQWHRKVG